MVEGKQQQRHFVLVHGAGHGAWCWYKVATRLRAEGYRVTALDMAAAGINPKRVDEVGSISDYCSPLTEILAALPPEERVVLVGHSMGGVCLSLAMEKYPARVSLAVFVTAFMPGPDLALLSLLAEYERQLGSYVDSHITSNGKRPTSLLFGPLFLASRLYQLSPPEDLFLATTLVRPVGLYDESELAKEMAVSEQNYGSVRRAYLVCEEDKILTQRFQEWMIEKNPVDEVKIMYGSDHMPMFSKPTELCSLLQELATKYC